MRDKFIELVKEYIAQRPDYKETLNEIKFNVLSVGATQEEFDEAIRQMGIPKTLAQTPGKTKNTPLLPKAPTAKPPFMNRLVEIDIATHIMVIFFLFVGISLFFLNPLIKAMTSGEGANTVADTKRDNNAQTLQELFTAQIYANTKVIDAQQVFSYKPKQHITLKYTGVPQKEIVGFFPYWMLSKEEEVSLDAITQLNLFGLTANGDGNIVTVASDGTPDPGWSMWNDPKLHKLLVRARRERSKVLLTFKVFNNTDIEHLVGSDRSQTTFIANALQLIQSNNLDGINLDFEYTGKVAQSVSDGFTRLVGNLNAQLRRQVPNARLTIDTYVTSAANPDLFDLEKIVDNVDSIIVMGYDFHTPKGEPGPIAPMDGAGLSISSLMQSYLEKIPSDKLVLAIAYYGYAWDVSAKNENLVLPYAAIADSSASTTIHWDDLAKSPWYRYVDPTTQTTRQVYFENTRSLGIKYDYINEKNLQGVGIWALGYDGQNLELEQLLVDKFTK